MTIIYLGIYLQKFIDIYIFLCLIKAYHMVFVNPKYLEIEYFKSRLSSFHFQNTQHLGKYLGIWKKNTHFTPSIQRKIKKIQT